MSAGRTPGPWEVFMAKAGNGDACLAVKSSKTGGCVAWVHGISDEETAENAKAIAETPRLLEACRYMLANAFEHKWDGDEKAFNMLTSVIRAASSGSTT